MFPFLYFKGNRNSWWFISWCGHKMEIETKLLTEEDVAQSKGGYSKMHNIIDLYIYYSPKFSLWKYCCSAEITNTIYITVEGLKIPHDHCFSVQ